MADLTQKNPFRCVFVVALAAALAAWGCGKNPTSPPVIPPLAQLTLSPDTLTVSVGETGFFSVSALDSAGAPVTGFPATWSSSDSGGVIISLGRSGRVSALSEGTARVFVESGGLRDSGVVVIVPPQRGWFTQASNANGANLNGVFFQPDGRTGWVVGNGGKILGTTDAGARWSVQTSGTGFNLNGVWFNRDREGWAVGANGTVLHTTDGGAHWGRVNAGASENLMDVFFANDSMGWAVGSNGAILRTRNRGESWQKLHPTVVTLHGVAFADTTHGWAVGDYGTIVGTHNGGAGWFVVQPAVASQTLKAVCRRSESSAWAAGAQGLAPRTVAGADSTVWQLRSAGAANQLEGTHFPTDSTGYVVGWNGIGAVLRSDNAGRTWTAQTANTQYRLNDVFFADSERGWAVGDGGTIIHTGTGGNP